MKIVYNKLIRDRIPEIIEADGKKAVIRKLDENQLLIELNRKLEEELAEYKEDGSVEELADLYEVIRGILRVKGVEEEEFFGILEKKAQKRGTFQEGLFLIEVEDHEAVEEMGQ